MRERERDASERERGFCERSRPERKRTAGGGSSSHSSSVLLVFSDFLSSCLFYFLLENHSHSSFYLHGTFLHLYIALFYFYRILPNEEHRYCCTLLRKGVLVRSLRACFANSFVRVASSLARFRETNWMDGAYTSEREKKKRFWRQCPILNPMTAR